MARLLYFILLCILSCSIRATDYEYDSDYDNDLNEDTDYNESYEEDLLPEDSVKTTKAAKTSRPPKNIGIIPSPVVLLSCTKPNEERKCVFSCPPERTCRNRNIRYKCARDKSSCKSKCVCKPGYYRNAIGQCISKAQCEQCSKPHEYFSCGGACDNVCSTLSYQNQTNCPIINIKCNEMCYCDAGYARDDKGNCIPINKCPVGRPCNQPNEERKCVFSCPPERTCRNLNVKYRCSKRSRSRCGSKCVCKPGYYRNAIGQCITKAQCKQCSKPHEYYSCGGACDNVCSTLSYQNQTNCPIINIKCNEMCYCDAEYARDDNGNCIPIDQCPIDYYYNDDSEYDYYNTYEGNEDASSEDSVGGDESTSVASTAQEKPRIIAPPLPPIQGCRQNEEERCVANCPMERTCQNRNVVIPCRVSGPCSNQCVCMFGFYRNEIGLCVTAAQCREGTIQIDSPIPIDDNEVMPAGSSASDWEDRLSKPKRGSILSLPPGPCSDPNEERRCVYNCPPERSCKNRFIQYRCKLDRSRCIPKCVCKVGYFRNDFGQCITEDQCNIIYDNTAPRGASSQPIPRRNCWTPKRICYGRNEERRCIKNCSPEATCRNRNIRYIRDPCEGDTSRCIPKCVCRLGYFRNDEGKCVTEAVCKITDDMTPGPLGVSVAETSTSQDDAVPPSGKPDQTPKRICIGRKEELRCIKNCSPETTCRNRNIRYIRDPCQGDTSRCIPKCVCRLGYFRNDEGKCVTEAVCKITDDKTPGPLGGPVADTPTSQDDAVPPPKQDQTPKRICIGRKEELRCIKNCSPETTCRNRNIRYIRDPCQGDTSRCIPKCVCKLGYFRNDKGKCVTEAVCKKTDDKTSLPRKPGQSYPPESLCNRNEERRCVKRCPPERTCRNRKIRYRCMLDRNPCVSKCACKPGYYRNTIGMCISEADCNRCPGRNEYFDCGSACDNVCSKIKFANQTNCPIKNIKCNEKCYCDPGYARDANGNCIPISRCPPSCDHPYEEYVLSTTCPPDRCISLVAKFKCDSNEVPKYRCRCQPGYLRLSEDTPCVPICACPEMANSPECADYLGLS